MIVVRATVSDGNRSGISAGVVNPEDLLTRVGDSGNCTIGIQNGGYCFSSDA